MGWLQQGCPGKGALSFPAAYFELSPEDPSMIWGRWGCEAAEPHGGIWVPIAGLGTGMEPCCLPRR